MAVREQPEVLAAERAFPMAQQLLAGVPLRTLPGRVDVGWHDSATHPKAGSFAILGPTGDPDLLGEVLRVRTDRREVFVLVVGIRPVPVPLSLARRAFLHLGLLALESRPCIVEVVE